MNWTTSLKEYKIYIKLERGLSENTIENYSRDIQKLILFIDNSKIDENPLKVSKETIKLFAHEVAKKVSPRSQARIISSLRSFFNYLMFEDIRKDNPTDLIETPKIGRKLPDTLSEKEIDKIIEAIDLSKPEGQRNKSILETLYGCGLRVSELINLTISDLFFDEGFIKVIGKGDKQRFVPIHHYCQKYITIYMDEIRPHINPKKGFEDTLFLSRRGERLSRQMIFLILKDLSKKAQINKSISPHTFRHSFASHLIQRGANLRIIQQMLGHESITTTEVYVHVDNNHLKDVMETYHPRK